MVDQIETGFGLSEDDDDDDKPGEPAADMGELARNWLSEIAQAERSFHDYWRRCDKIQKIYVEARKQAESEDNDGERKFSILWANLATLQPATYSRTPKPVVQRRYRDRDPIARNVCNFQERALEYNYDKIKFDKTMKAVRDDFLLFARGCVWIRYDATIEKKPDPNDMTGQAMIPSITGEKVPCDHVHFRDFLHPKVRNWEELPWIARRVYMTRKEVTKRFGKEIGQEISLTHKPSDVSDDNYTGENARKAVVFEIWSRKDNKCIWVSPGYQEALDYDDPHLQLEDFWPCPMPAYGTMATDSLIPIPDYVYYQDQAEEIDELTNRIGALTDALKLVGFYPSGPTGEGSAAFELAMSPGVENEMIAIPSWAGFSEKGGVGAIQWWPVDQVIKVIQACFETRSKLIEDVYQITGISDIVRGDSNPHETLGAQKIKTQWGSIRIRDRQTEIARFARDVTNIMGEIIADKFQPETLVDMTGLHLRTDAEVDAEYQQELAAWQMQMMQIAQASQPALPQLTGPSNGSSMLGAPGPASQMLPPPQGSMATPPPSAMAAALQSAPPPGTSLQ